MDGRISPPRYSSVVQVPPSNHFHENLRRRSRSFGSESDFHDYRDQTHRSNSIENLQVESLRRRSPKYVSSVEVGDDGFKISTVQVPRFTHHGPLRFYSEPGPSVPAEVWSSVPVGQFDTVNPAYASDDSDHGTPSRVKSYQYGHKNPEPTPTRYNLERVHTTDGSKSSQRPALYQKDGLQSFMNPVFRSDSAEEMNNVEEVLTVSVRRPNNNKISAEITEMTTMSFTGNPGRDTDLDSSRNSNISLHFSDRSPSVRESNLDSIASSTNRTYLVDDPRYLVGPGAAMGKQDQVDNNGAFNVTEAAASQSEPASENKTPRFHKPNTRPWGRRKRVYMSIAASILLVALITFICLFRYSFIYVEYSQIALRRSKTTWKVHDETYYPGCHLRGPDMELFRYNSTAHKEFFDEIAVFTKDKNTLQFSATVWWFIRSDELPQLYNKFGRNFSTVFPDMFLSTLRNTAPLFTSQDYLSKRNEIEATFHQALYDKVSGDCCPRCCTGRIGCSSDFVKSQCTRCSEAKSCDKGDHIDIRYFYVGEIKIPEEIEGRYLKSLIVEVENEKAQFEQEEAVVRIQNEYLVKNILNKAEEVKSKSEAEAKKIRDIASIEGDVIEQKATVSALRGMCSKFNITEEDQKLSLFFFNSIKSMNNIHGFIHDKTK